MSILKRQTGALGYIFKGAVTMSKQKLYAGLFFLLLGVAVYFLGGIKYAFDLGVSEVRIYPAYFFTLLGLVILVQGWWRSRQIQ
jgi:hypothetical protein